MMAYKIFSKSRWTKIPDKYPVWEKNKTELYVRPLTTGKSVVMRESPRGAFEKVFANKTQALAYAKSWMRRH